MAERILIDVDDIQFDEDSAALVVCTPTGIFYTAQCGGMCCSHPVAEGFFLPMWELLPEIDDCDFGCSHLTKSPQNDRPDLRQKLAAAIDAGLQRVPQMSFSLRFDFDRIDELQEGWWPLRITGRLHDVGPLDHRCYYHSGNCD